MTGNNFRERALELRGFINGYIAERGSGLAPHTKATLAFLDDFLRAAPDKTTDGHGLVVTADLGSTGLDSDAPATDRQPSPLANESSWSRESSSEHPSNQSNSAGSAIKDDGQASCFPGQLDGNNADRVKIETFLATKAANPQAVAETSPIERPEKKRNSWTPEARAAQAQRMRERHAAGTMKRSGGEESTASEPPASVAQHNKTIEPPHVTSPVTASLSRPTPLSEPPQPHRLSVSHPGWAGKREDNQLHDSDWPDIKDMVIKGRTHLSIASDFDVEPETLKAFIDSKLARYRDKAEKPPGEAGAPAA